MIRVTIQVAVSHGYLADGDSKVVMRQKISELMKTMPVNPETGQRPCPMTSCHKVWIIHDDLVNRAFCKSEYHKPFKSATPILLGWHQQLQKVVQLQLQSQLTQVQQDSADQQQLVAALHVQQQQYDALHVQQQQHERQLLLVCLFGVAVVFALMQLKKI